MKHKQKMHLTNFIFTLTFFLIASYQILKNGVILMNKGSFFQEEDFLQPSRFQLSKPNELLPNSIRATCAYSKTVQFSRW